MIYEICSRIHNFFYFGDALKGTFTIENHSIMIPSLLVGQYYEIFGSALNDGVYKYGDSSISLKDETFTGEIRPMSLPPKFESLCGEIKTWCDKYLSADSESSALSPFNSESFGGYSYSKSTGGAGNGTGLSASDWMSVFASRLSPWRKLK